VQAGQQLCRAAALEATARAASASRSPSPPHATNSPPCTSGASVATTATGTAATAAECGSPASCDTGYGSPPPPQPRMQTRQATRAAALKRDADVYDKAPIQQLLQLQHPAAYPQACWF
jgi:hypothetical protein